VYPRPHRAPDWPLAHLSSRSRVSAISMRSTVAPRPKPAARHTIHHGNVAAIDLFEFSSLAARGWVNAISPSMVCKPSLLPIAQPCPAAKDRVMKERIRLGDEGDRVDLRGSLAGTKSQGRMAASPVMSTHRSAAACRTSVSAQGSDHGAGGAHLGQGLQLLR